MFGLMIFHLLREQIVDTLLRYLIVSFGLENWISHMIAEHMRMPFLLGIQLKIVLQI